MLDLIPHGWMHRYVLTLLMSFGVSLLLTYLSIIVLKRLKLMDVPDERKIHKTPVPRMGGIAVYIGFVLPMMAIMEFTHPQEGIIIGSGLALAIGLLDDVWRLNAVIKLVALFLLTILIWRFGVITRLPFIWQDFGRFANLAITMLWLTGVCSAINAIDHMDGLAGGVAVIASAAYFAVSVQTAQWFWGLMSLAMIGSLLGFLVFNRHPAKIFMGDCGSFFVGFSLGSIGIMGNWSENPLKASIIPFAILSIPIMDLIYVILARKITGVTRSIAESITYCGKDHIGHRFTQLGFSQPNSVRIICLISATVSISALLIRHTNELGSFLLLIQILMVYIILFLLMKPPSRKPEPR